MEKFTKLFNVVAAPMTAFFILGMFSRRVNTGGAVIGAVAGVSFAIVFNGIPGIVEKQLDWINWMWGAGLATIVNIAVGYAASYLFPPPPPKSLEGTTFWRESRYPLNRKRQQIALQSGWIVRARAFQGRR